MNIHEAFHVEMVCFVFLRRAPKLATSPGTEVYLCAFYKQLFLTEGDRENLSLLKCSYKVIH